MALPGNPLSEESNIDTMQCWIEESYGVAGFRLHEDPAHNKEIKKPSAEEFGKLNDPHDMTVHDTYFREVLSANRTSKQANCCQRALRR